MTAADDLLPMVEDLVDRLRRDGATRLAAVLDHRMHKVAWTSASELLEELRAVLREVDETERMTEQTRSALARVAQGLNEPSRER